jgi:hypothetical protein
LQLCNDAPIAPCVNAAFLDVFEMRSAGTQRAMCFCTSRGCDGEADAEMATAREQYFDKFATHGDAVEFEQQVLSVGAEYLPECAKATLAGADSSDEYWVWLSGQYDELYAEWLADQDAMNA